MARGRRLAVPTGTGTRPTSDRAREALFSTLTSMVGAWAGRRVLDLYAGSGAVGLEAVSRGADHCFLVESDPRALRTLRANIETVGLTGAEASGARVERLVSDGPPGGRRMPWGPPRVLLTSALLLQRGMRCGVSAQRGPQWLKRRSERIRPVPAVWLLHLWK